MRYAKPVLFCAFWALLNLPALADEIHHEDGPRDQYMDVEVTTINYKTVFFKFTNLPQAGEQQESMNDVAKVVFTIKPADYESGEAYLEQGNYGAAIGSFERAMRDRQRNGWVDQYALYYVARCHQMMGNAAQAAESYRSLLQKFPETVHLGDTHLSLAEIALATGDTSEAQEVLRELVKKVRDNNLKRAWSLQANFHLCRISEQAGQHEDARKAYRELADEAESQNRLVYFQAKAGYARCMAAAGMGDQANREAQELISEMEQEEDTWDPEALASAWNIQAAYLFDQKEHKASLLAALRVVTMYPVDRELPQALFYAARCFYLLRDKGEDWEGRASSMADRLRREFPRSPFAQRSYKN